MAKSTELKYFPDATANCSNCKSIFTIGMTVEKVTVEICGNCHPFYTGQETLIDTAGRIEKFQARAALVADASSKKEKVKSRKVRQSLADLSAGEGKAEDVKLKKPKVVKLVEAVKEETAVEIVETVPVVTVN